MALFKSIYMAKTMRKKNLKIQILAGNTLISCLHTRSQETLPLVLAHIVGGDCAAHSVR